MVMVRFGRFGEPSDVLEVVPDDPKEPGPGEVQVRMGLRPVNPSDLFQIRGKYGRLPALPATPGLEGLGVVEAMGSPVQGCFPGQRVVFREVQGTWADVLVTRPEQLIPVPAHVPDDAAAQVMVNPLTAAAMVRELAPPEGAWVVLTAAGSAVGLCVLDLAKLKGFRVLALVRDGRHANMLRTRGAEVVLSTQTASWFDEAKAVLGDGAWGALDAVGGSQAARLAMLVRPSGTLLVFGALSMEPLQVPGGQIIYRQLTVRGFMVSAWKRHVGEDGFRTTLADVFDAQAQGLLCPPVAARYPLAHVLDAVQAAEAPGRVGKILLTDRA